MTPFSDTAEQPTPGPVLVGVAMLGLTTLLSLPSPFFTGLLLAPVFGATAVLGYRRVRWAGFVGLGASAFALLTALIAAIVSTSQATAGSTLLAALGALLVGLCALAGGVGSGVLVIYRNHLAGSRRRTSFSPQQPPSTYESASASEREFPSVPGRRRCAESPAADSFRRGAGGRRFAAARRGPPQGRARCGHWGACSCTGRRRGVGLAETTGSCPRRARSSGGGSSRAGVLQHASDGHEEARARGRGNSQGAALAGLQIQQPTLRPPSWRAAGRSDRRPRLRAPLGCSIESLCSTCWNIRDG